MEYSNEFLARVYGAYIFSQYHMNDKHGVYTDTIAPALLQAIYCGAARKGQLILTPLSSISDEHAIEVAKIYRPMTKVYHTPLVGNHVIVKIIDRQFIDAQFLVIQMIVDYLRSKGYDCGYAHINSLIKSGLAIDKTTLNN